MMRSGALPRGEVLEPDIAQGTAGLNRYGNNLSTLGSGQVVGTCLSDVACS